MAHLFFSLLTLEKHVPWRFLQIVASRPEAPPSVEYTDLGCATWKLFPVLPLTARHYESSKDSKLLGRVDAVYC